MLGARHDAVLVVMGVIGALMIVLATSNHGPGISADSVVYIATARNIAAGIGVISYDNAPMVLYAPLYPAFLAALAYLFSTDPFAIAHHVNAILFGIIVYLSGKLFCRYFRGSAQFAFIGALLALVGFPLVQVSLAAWSEPLFIVFVLLSFILFENYRAQGRVIFLYLFSLSVALACLCRYVGVVFVVTGAIGIWIFCQGSATMKLRHSLVFLLVSALPIGLWAMRNYILSGTLFGPRAPSEYSLLENIVFVFESIVSWYGVPRRLIAHYRLAALALLAALAFFGVLLVRKRHAAVTSPSVLLLPTATYLVFLVVCSSLTACDQISNRFLSPVFVPTTLIFLGLSYEAANLFSHRLVWKKYAKTLLVGGLFVWLAYLTLMTGQSIVYSMNQGLGYNSKYWKYSHTVGHLLNNQVLRSACPIYTNGPDVLYLLAGIVARWSPMKTMYNSPKIINELTGLRGVWPEGHNCCLVWFDRIQREYLFTVDELRAIAALQEIVRLDDGTIYFVARK